MSRVNPGDKRSATGVLTYTWEDWPDIGESDWRDVIAEIERLGPPVDLRELVAARALFTTRSKLK